MAQFINKATIETVKARNNGAQFIIQEADSRPGLFFFACGLETGYCSKEAAKATDASQLQVCDVVTDEGETYHMVTMAGTGGLAKHAVRTF